MRGQSGAINIITKSLGPQFVGGEHRRSTLTVSSAPRWCTVQGISTMEPTWDVMLVKLAVLNEVVSSAASLVDNWFELWLLVVFAILNPTPNPLLLLVEFLGLLRLFKFLLESLIELGTVKLPASALSRSKIFVWFCSTFLGIIRKPFGEKRGLKWLMMRAKLRHYRFLRSRTLRARRQPASIVWAGNVIWIRCFWLSWQRFCGLKVLSKAVTRKTKSVSLSGGFKASPVHISSHTRLIWSPRNLFRKVYSGIWISAFAATRPRLRMNSLCLFSPATVDVHVCTQSHIKRFATVISLFYVAFHSLSSQRDFLTLIHEVALPCTPLSGFL